MDYYETTNIGQPQATDAPTPPENVAFPNTSTGQLTVSVQTASGLFPVTGATVTVAPVQNQSEILFTSTTDRNGRSETFTLPAPAKADSQQPSDVLPFSEYRIVVTHPDFFTAIIENVQIFGSINSFLPINLVPLPEFSEGSNPNIVIIPNQNL